MHIRGFYLGTMSYGVVKSGTGGMVYHTRSYLRDPIYGDLPTLPVRVLSVLLDASRIFQVSIGSDNYWPDPKVCWVQYRID